MVERQLQESGTLNDLEENFSEQHATSGYETGLEVGKQAGQEEGFSQGQIEGKGRGSEIGFYKGYIMTWRLLLMQDTPETFKMSKTLKKLNETLDLVEAYPTTNETNCEEKLSKIRAKFKQSISLLKVNDYKT